MTPDRYIEAADIARMQFEFAVIDGRDTLTVILDGEALLCQQDLAPPGVHDSYAEMARWYGFEFEKEAVREAFDARVRSAVDAHRGPATGGRPPLQTEADARCYSISEDRAALVCTLSIQGHVDEIRILHGELEELRRELAALVRERIEARLRGHTKVA